jgi:hypothetical protein
MVQVRKAPGGPQTKLLDAVASRLGDPQAKSGADCPECRRVRHAVALAAELPA